MKTKNIAIITILLVPILLLLSACAGIVEKPYIYSPYEGKSGPVKGATGEQTYCAHGLPQQVQDRKKQAFANIAKACGGEDKYAIVEELAGSPARTTALGIETSCTGFAGRVIYFKCKGAKPVPSGYSK